MIPSPTRDVEVLFRMVHTSLENFRADSPIVALHLSAEPCMPQSGQFGLFETALRDPNRFYETLARLHALVGNDRVGTPVVESMRRPYTFRMEPVEFAVRESASPRSQAAQVRDPLSLIRNFPGLVL